MHHIVYETIDLTNGHVLYLSKNKEINLNLKAVTIFLFETSGNITTNNLIQAKYVVSSKRVIYHVETTTNKKLASKFNAVPD